MSRRWLLTLAAATIAGAGWYAFRPERAFLDTTVHEAFPATGQGETAAATLLTGSFHSNAHETRGTATVYGLPDGRRVLRLTTFETSNGPDVVVYLVAATDVIDDRTVTEAGFVNLGSLKGNVGDQNYDIPLDLDLSRFRAVTIWCRRFSVTFGTAPLS